MSSAVELTSSMVCCEPLPGTVTTSRFDPCGWTCAPELPVVDPRLDDADRGVHLFGRRRLPGQGLRPQGHLGATGQVKTESYLEPVLPLAWGEQLRAEYAQQHGHDEDQQKHEGPSRMRDGSRWGCHFSACLRSAVSRKPSCRTAAQCTLSLSDLARSS